LDELIEGFGEDFPMMSITEVPCGGRLGGDVIADALTGYDKVLVAVCIDGACRHIDGGKRACKQTERVASMLEKSGISEKRLKCVEVSYAMPNVFAEGVKSFLKTDIMEEPS
jgi:coenzyme F420-reducing hydrogenase delta subunit